MIVYFAAGGSRQAIEICTQVAEVEAGVLRCPLLFSYVYRDNVRHLLGYLNRNDLQIDNVMLDSGAFSVKTGRATVRLEKYASYAHDLLTSQFIQKKVQQLELVNLDVIPKHRKNRQEREQCAKESFDNWIRLKELGVDTLPVFHARESFKWLDKMLEQSSYIGLGGAVDQSVEANSEWFDLVFTYLDKLNIPNLKVHGFGQTSRRILERYSWTSVDSTSAFKAAGYGKIFYDYYTRATINVMNLRRGADEINKEKSQD